VIITTRKKLHHAIVGSALQRILPMPAGWRTLRRKVNNPDIEEAPVHGRHLSIR
jgi:hypothetical protein